MREKLKLSFYFDYAKKSHKKGRVLKNIMIFLCSLAIAFSAIVYNFGDAYIDEQEELLNQISNTEIFVVNKTTPLKLTVDLDENLSITPKELESMGMISETDHIYPFFEFRSSGYDVDLDTGITQCKIVIIKNGAENEYTFDTNNTDEFDAFNVIPYYPEQGLDKRFEIKSKDIKNGVYVSNHLAELLNIHDLNSSVRLDFDIYIPVRLFDTVMSVGKKESQYDIDVDIAKKVNLSFELTGVLGSNVRNTYTTSGDNLLYVPYPVMQDILDNTQNNYTEAAGAGQNYKEWHPSAYVVFAKSYNDVQPVMSKIATINPNFRSVSNYQDVDSMNRMIESTRNTGRWIIVIVLAIIFILMSIIYLNNTLRRKYEISVLKANGMTRTELFKLVMAESIRHIVFVTLISIIIAAVLIWVVNLLFGMDVISFSVSIVIHNVLVSILSILIPTVIAVVAINRFKPDQIMRN